MAKLDRLEEALTKAQAGDFAKARTLSRDLANVPPAHPLLAPLGVVLFEAGEAVLALRFLERRAAGGAADALYDRAVVLAALGRTEEAAAVLRKCLERAPTHAAALTNLGGLELAAGNSAEAERCWRALLAADGTSVPALHNLAGLCLAQGRRDEAEDLARRAHDLSGSPDTALRLADALGEAGRHAEAEAVVNPVIDGRPDDARLWRALAHARKKLGRTGEALAAYRTAHGLDPQDGEARHMIAALTGESPAAAPVDYVRGFFDTYADRFERHLLEDVQYQAPARLRALYDRVVGDARLGAVVDLGCGTGLTARAFADRAERIIGVDLSPRMLQLAAETGLYAELGEVDAATALTRCHGLSAVLATDLFIYVGDLEAIIAGAARALVPGGRLLFSTEAAEEGDFTLRPSGRYAQSPAYVRRLLAAHGLTEEACERGPIRGGSDGDIQGDYWAARKG